MFSILSSANTCTNRTSKMKKVFIIRLIEVGKVEYSRKDHHEKDSKNLKSVPILPSKSLTIQKSATVSKFAKSFSID